MDHANLVIEHSDMTMRDCPNASCQSGHGRIQIVYESPNGAGLTIRSNRFYGKTCGDGIQFGGHAGRGVRIVGNHFINMTQDACTSLEPFAGKTACHPYTQDCPSPHIDPVQGVDSTGWVFENNFIEGSSTGVVNYDDDSTGVIVRNNVIEADGDAICLGGGANTTIEHNTVRSGGVYLCVNHDGDPSSNVTWRNNIVPRPPDVQGDSSFAVNEHNLCTDGGCRGARNLNRRPRWVGGRDPNSFAGFALTRGSPGKSAASDGRDIGVNPRKRRGT
jgi:hypothetical protein